jgi:hypothetical protein
MYFPVQTSMEIDKYNRLIFILSKLCDLNLK